MSVLKTEAEFFFELLVLPCRQQSLYPESRRDSVRLQQTLIFGKLIQSMDRPLGFQKVQAPRTNRHSLTHRSPLFSRKHSRYSFLLEAEPTTEPYCGLKDNVNEKFQWHHRESNPQPSAWSAVPQPTVPPRTPVNCWRLDKLLNPHVWISFYHSCT